ncbi:hypothetical protein BH11MYX3_BH11MYX3_38330 [soil metagenome]
MKWIPCVLLLATASCMVGDEDEFEGEDDGDLSIAANRYVAGVNGSYCIASPFNCRFRQGGSRVTTAAGGETWGIIPGASARDGNGTALSTETATRLTFNYGQTRYLAGTAHALALTTANNSAAWYPIDHIKGETSFRARMGEVNGKDPGKGPMACYQIRNSHDASIELKKVVRDSSATHERAGDYLPLVRANGVRSANLVFSVPGFGLGGATTDHFVAGTKFQRVEVPTSEGNPSITIPLWVKAANGHYTRQSGELRFFYGYIKASDGAKRFGWMAEDALQVSTGC